MELNPEIREHRVPEHGVDVQFLNRWSPRAFSSQSVPDELLNSVLEAARWAASSYNEQPWRFIVAKTPDDHAKFLDLLVPGNQAWAKDAPILIITVSKKTFSRNGKPNRVHQHDLGAASAYMALAASGHGLYAHGMVGFDDEKAREVLGVPDDYEIGAAWALGYRGETAQLPEDYQKMEAPSERRPLWEIVMEGGFRPVPPDESQQL